MTAALLALLAAAPSSVVERDGTWETSASRELDVERYLGTWYELARYDHFFERGCASVTATYSKLEGGDLRVINQCRKGSPDGAQKRVSGKAWAPERTQPGKLKVQFFWPFAGDYWVLEVARDYSWALVGDPTRQSCWILSRTPQMDDALYAQLLERLQAYGFDPSKLLRVEHAR